MRVFKGFRWLDGLGLLAMFGVVLWALGQLPQRVPVHFGWNGQPDRYGSRDEATFLLFLLPIVFSVVYGILKSLPRLDPRGSRDPRVLEQVSSVLLVFGVMLTVSITQSMLSSAAYAMIRTVLAGLGVLFAVMGSALPKTPPNLWVGIRLSYTLSSDLAWSRIHRIGGWWMTVYGLVLLCLSLIPLEWVVKVALLSLVPITVLGIFLLNARARAFWQADPQRRPVR